MSGPPPIPGNPNRIGLWLGILAAAILIPSVLIVGLFVRFRVTTSNAERRLEAQVSENGEPLSLQKLADQYPSIPENENVAMALLELWEQKDPTYWAAFRRKERPLPEQSEENVATNVPFLGSKQSRLGRSERLSDDARSAAEAYLDEQAEYISSLRMALKRPRSCFPEEIFPISEGFQASLPYLPALKRDLYRIRLVGALALDRGNAPEAIQALEDMAATGQALRENPLLIDQLTRVSCLRLVLEDAQRLLSQIEVPPSDLDRLEQLFQRCEVRGSLRKALVSERALCLTIFDPPAGSLRAFLGRAELDSEPGSNSESLERGFRLGMSGLKATGIAGADRRLILETLGQAIRLSTNASPGALEEYARLFASAEKESRRFPPKLFSGLLLPRLRNSAAGFAGFEARRRAGVAALGVERYRLAHGHLPHALEEVAPNYLPSLPKDPFTGEPLSYRRLETGFVVYSTGEDRVDNQGKERTRNGTSRQRDEVFVVER